MKNLRSVDLNLLVILDALLDEAHVSRAARRIGLSQSAASNALERSRHLFQDGLLERQAGGMRLTTKAESLREPIKKILNEVSGLIDSKVPALSEVKQTVRIASADQPGAMIAAPLCAAIQQSAPGLELVFQPWAGASAVLNGLAKGDCDIAISVFQSDDISIKTQALMSDRYVVAMRKEHPLSQNFSLENWLAYPHVFTSGRGERQNLLDQQLAGMNLSRKIGVIVPSFLMVPAILRQSDFVAMVPSLIISTLVNRDDYVIFPTPLTVPDLSLQIAWHSRRSRDIAVQHVVSVITEIMNSKNLVEN